MKKILSVVLILILLCLVLYYYATHVNTETITRKSITVNNCTAEYVHYKNDNIKNIAETHGHAPNNIMEVGWAKMEIAKCLCDNYLIRKTASDSIEIINILNSPEYSDLKNIFEPNSEYFQTDTLRLEFACKNKEKYFERFVLD
ncbi:hypothetical protein [Cytophaga aurantiaca]|uniref:hypothetical protein n=1 Tax=Cytophaga aurantiaca TaxID=29530 RepID=UPI00035C7492|nr:hypothetical protein [Cytophaga aurantiaca]